MFENLYLLNLLFPLVHSSDIVSMTKIYLLQLSWAENVIESHWVVFNEGSKIIVRKSMTNLSIDGKRIKLLKNPRKLFKIEEILYISSEIL